MPFYNLLYLDPMQYILINNKINMLVLNYKVKIRRKDYNNHAMHECIIFCKEARVISHPIFIAWDEYNLDHK